MCIGREGIFVYFSKKVAGSCSLPSPAHCPSWKARSLDSHALYKPIVRVASLMP